MNTDKFAEEQRNREPKLRFNLNIKQATSYQDSDWVYRQILRN